MNALAALKGEMNAADGRSEDLNRRVVIGERCRVDATIFDRQDDDVNMGSFVDDVLDAATTMIM